MSKEVFLEILKRSVWLAGLLALGSLGTLLTMRAAWLEVVIGTILVPVLGVIAKVLRAYFKNRGKLTVADIDAAFDEASSEADSKIDPTD